MWNSWDHALGISGLSRKVLFQPGPPKTDKIDLSAITGFWTIMILSDGSNPVFPRGFSNTYVFQMKLKPSHRDEVLTADQRNIICDSNAKVTDLQVVQRDENFFKSITLEVERVRGHVFIPLIFNQPKKVVVPAVLPILKRHT